MATAHIELPLSCGLVAKVDVDDYERVRDRTWWADVKAQATYARSRAGRGRGQPAEYLHRVLLLPPPGLQVDHIDGDGLDNRRSNLRLATPRQNSNNTRRHRDSTSPYKGVVPSRHRWVARLWDGSKNRYLGTFDTSKQAARAYDAALVDLHGEYAKTNFAA